MFAYVFACFNPGTERDAFEKLSEKKEIKDINMVFGEWDIIIKVQVESPEALEQFVLDEIRTIKGNRLTSTMIVAR